MIWNLFEFPPRRWQAEAVPLAMEAIRRGEAGIVQACTGAGKSVFTAAICGTVLRTLRPGWVVVVAVPSEALVAQTAAALRKPLGETQVGEWYGRRKSKDAPIVVVCYDSLRTFVDALAVDGRRVALYLADEVHRSSVDSVLDVVSEMEPATRLGLTATPFRSVEGEALRGWDSVIYRYTIDQAIADGVLVPFRPILWDGPEDTSATHASIDMIKAHAPEGPGVVSATTIEDAIETAEILTAHGIPSEPVHSRMSRKAVAATLDRLQSGELRAVVHVALLVEGVDLPWLRWLCMRRPRSAAVGIVQEVGRVLRTMSQPDAFGSKREAVILLPHATPILRSMAREADLDPVAAAKALREKMEEEVDPVERAETDPTVRLARSVGDVRGYVEELFEAVARLHQIDRWDISEDQRQRAPSVRQLQDLTRITEDRRRWGGRYLPERHREAVAALIEVPEVLTMGTASDLSHLLRGLRRESGRRYRAAEAKGLPKAKRFWKGVTEEGLPDVPEALIEAADHVRRAKRGRGA